MFAVAELTQHESDRLRVDQDGNATEAQIWSAPIQGAPTENGVAVLKDW